MTFANVLAWIIVAALCLVALFIVVVICILLFKSVRSLLRRLDISDKKEA